MNSQESIFQALKELYPSAYAWHQVPPIAFLVMLIGSLLVLWFFVLNKKRCGDEMERRIIYTLLCSAVLSLITYLPCRIYAQTKGPDLETTAKILATKFTWEPNSERSITITESDLIEVTAFGERKGLKNDSPASTIVYIDQVKQIEALLMRKGQSNAELKIAGERMASTLGK